MAQGLFKALMLGAKEEEAANKVVKFVAWFGIISSLIALSIWFIPFPPLQVALNASGFTLPFMLALVVVSIIFNVFILKKHLWPAIILVLLTIGDIILTYQETGKIFGSHDVVRVLLYMSVLQAIYFLKKKKNEQQE